MIIDTLAQEITTVSPEAQPAFVAVNDVELMYVGGGSATGSYF